METRQNYVRFIFMTRNFISSIINFNMRREIGVKYFKDRKAFIECSDEIKRCLKRYLRLQSRKEKKGKKIFDSV